MGGIPVIAALQEHLRVPVRPSHITKEEVMLELAITPDLSGGMSVAVTSWSNMVRWIICSTHFTALVVVATRLVQG